MNHCRVLVGGDVCPTHGDVAEFSRGDAEAIFHDLLDDFARADLTVVNLECPLTDQDTPILKCGPHLRAPTACMAGIRAAGIGLVDLANNHVLDHGPAGMDDTLRAAEAAGIPVVGGGRNLSEARRVFIKDLQGIRVGILAMTHHEFTMATPTSPGANPLDLIDFTRNLAAERANFDRLLVLLHAGNEGYPYPSPRLMETCRFFVEQGADAVICHHSHCPGCCEEYRGAPIVYGQGNFIFKKPGSDRSWHEGFLVHLAVPESGKIEAALIPFEQLPDEAGARRLQATAAADFLESVARRSRQIQDPAFVRERWIQFCEEARSFYLGAVLGHGKLLRWLDQRLGVTRRLYSARALRAVGLMIRCEAHREVLETLLSPQRAGQREEKPSKGSP